MKQLLIAAIVLATITTQAQPFAQTAWTNIGPDLAIGGTFDKIVVQGSYGFHIAKKTVPATITITGGYEAVIRPKISLTALAGIAQVKYSNFDQHDRETKISKIVPAGAIELGYDSYNGRILIFTRYSNGFIFGGGLRFYIDRE